MPITIAKARAKAKDKATAIAMDETVDTVLY
jgi:hypothetical protein